MKGKHFGWYSIPRIHELLLLDLTDPAQVLMKNESLINRDPSILIKQVEIDHLRENIFNVMLKIALLFAQSSLQFRDKLVYLIIGLRA